MATTIKNAILLHNKDTEIAVGTEGNELVMVFKSDEAVLTETFHIAQEGHPDDYKISTISANFNQGELVMNESWVDMEAFAKAIRNRAEDYVASFTDNDKAVNLIRDYIEKLG